MAEQQKREGQGVRVLALWAKDGGIELGSGTVKTSLQVEPTPTPGFRNLDMRKAVGEVVVSFDDKKEKRQVFCIPIAQLRSYQVEA